MSKLSKDKKQRLLVVAGITAGAVVLLWFGLIGPLRSKLAELDTKAKDAQAMVDQGVRSISFAQQVSNELAAASEHLQTAEAVMASGDLYDWMHRAMAKLQDTHAALGIPQISRESVGEVGMFPKFPYKAATFSIRGAAFYEDVGQLVVDLENQYPFVQVQNLQLSSSSAQRGGEAERLQFSFDLTALIKPVTQ
jgi:hypothetical protein